MKTTRTVAVVGMVAAALVTTVAPATGLETSGSVTDVNLQELVSTPKLISVTEIFPAFGRLPAVNRYEYEGGIVVSASDVSEISFEPVALPTAGEPSEMAVATTPAQEPTNAQDAADWANDYAASGRTEVELARAVGVSDELIRQLEASAVVLDAPAVDVPEISDNPSHMPCVFDHYQILPHECVGDYVAPATALVPKEGESETPGAPVEPVAVTSNPIVGDVAQEVNKHVAVTTGEYGKAGTTGQIYATGCKTLETSGAKWDACYKRLNTADSDPSYWYTSDASLGAGKGAWYKALLKGRTGHTYGDYSRGVVDWAPSVDQSVGSCSTLSVGVTGYGASATYSTDRCPNTWNVERWTRGFYNQWEGRSTGATRNAVASNNTKVVSGFHSGFTHAVYFQWMWT